MTALLDADIIAYRCAASAEYEPVDIAILRVDQMMRELLSNEPNYLAFISGEGNFRKLINPEYKANRKDKPKPIHLKACEDFLVQEYGAVVTEGYEADDALGMNQTPDTTIYSIDKDLLMIPGCHYNFVRKEYTEVSEIEALQRFYKQMLIGDTADNIIGVEGIGKVRAGNLIDHLTDEEDMYNEVFFKYSSPSRFQMNADCLWIWRKLGETFTRRRNENYKETSSEGSEGEGVPVEI